MIKPTKSGEPLLFGQSMIHPEMVMSAAGSYEEGQGTRIVLDEGHLVFMAAFDGTEFRHGIPIEWVLECITRYSRLHES